MRDFSAALSVNLKATLRIGVTDDSSLIIISSSNLSGRKRTEITPSCVVSLTDLCELLLLGCARETHTMASFSGGRGKRTENHLISLFV